MNLRKKGGGFTLIEMLVAITLVALMGVVCFRGLSFVASQRASIEQETSELAQLVRAFAQMETDLAERLPDIASPARATTPELPLSVSIGSDASGSAMLEVLRTVATGAMQSRPVHVLYRIDARGLVRSTGTDEVLVLPGVSRMQVRVNAGGFWLESGVASTAVRPFTRAGALEIVVNDREGARYTKVIAL